MGPPGRRVGVRVVETPVALFGALLDRAFTGHVTIAAPEALLFESADQAVLGFIDGIPRTAVDETTGATGPEALAAIEEAWPARVERWACGPEAVGGTGAIEPAAPARAVVGDEALARRTAAAAPDVDAPAPSLDAVESFLGDAAAVSAIQDRAREAASRRAEEWDLPVEE